MLNGLWMQAAIYRGVSTLQNRTVILSLNGNYMAAEILIMMVLLHLEYVGEDYQVRAGFWIFEMAFRHCTKWKRNTARSIRIKDGEIYVKSELHNEDCEDTELILNGKITALENGFNILIYDQI